MSAKKDPTSTASGTAKPGTVDTKLEVVVIPVSDVDRAKEFYERLGWRFDADRVDGEFRLIQFTPTGSSCSVQFGTNLTPAAPGSARALLLIVSDIEAAHDDLVARAVEVSGVFHCSTGPCAGSGTPARTTVHPGQRPRAVAAAPTFRSAIRTATVGCCRKSRPGSPDAPILP
jgi:predicted enzyme related to lactoylglutathione lyase